MNILKSIGDKISEHFEKKRQEQEEFEAMRRQAQFEERIAQEQKEKRDALKRAREEAIRTAKNKTGIQRLRALNRASRLTESNPGTLFSTLSQRTQENLKRTEENIRRNQRIRLEAKRLREERLRKAQLERIRRMAGYHSIIQH